MISLLKLKPQRIGSLGAHRNWAAIFFGESSLELVTAKTVGDQVNIDRQTSTDVAPTEENADPKVAMDAAVQSLRQQVDPREHRIVTAVSCDDVLCQSLRLPTTKLDELKQMLDLQIDNLTPLPLEDVVYSFEPIEKTETNTRVLVAVARKVVVNERVAALEEAGLEAEVVGIDVLAVFRSLVHRNVLPSDENLNAFVLFSAKAANIIVHSRGNPITVRSLVVGEGALDSAVFREDLSRTLIAAEAEMPNCSIGRVTFATWNERLRAEVEDLARTWSQQAEFLANGSSPSPAHSLCVETATTDAGARLNLLPDEWRQRRRTARLRQTFLRGAISVGGVYLLVLLAFLTMMGIRKAQYSRVDLEIRKQQGHFSRARELHKLLVEMQQQIDPKFSAIELLRQVTTLMPENLKLNSFEFKKRDGTVKLLGQTPEAATAIEFGRRLEKCELFSKVTTGKMNSVGGLTKFDVICYLKTGAAAPGPLPWR